MCMHVHAHVQVDAIRHKHVLLFVAEALTGSLEFERLGKMKQLRALRGKLRDGTIRGRRARQAATLEMEKLKKELNISSDEEIYSKIDDGRSVKDDGRLHDSKDERLRESPTNQKEVPLQSTEESSVDDDSRVLPDANSEPRLSEATEMESSINSTNQNEATIPGAELSSGDDSKLLSNSKAPQSSHNEGMGEPSDSSDGAASPDSLCEDETRISGKLYLQTHTHTHTHTQFVITR